MTKRQFPLSFGVLHFVIITLSNVEPKEEPKMLKQRQALLVIVIGLLAATACSSKSDSSSGTRPTTRPIAKATTSSPPISVGPTDPAPGHDSPGAAAVSLLDAVAASNFTAACGYVVPDQQAKCNQDLAQAVQQQTPNPTLKNLAAPTTVTSANPADRAIVVVSGTFCSTPPGAVPQCLTNTDAQAEVPQGASFDTQYNFVGAATGTPWSGDFATQAVLKNGQWHVPLGI